MSTISASTTTTTAYSVTADTTGTLVLKTGASPTTAVTIDGSQNVGLGAVPSAWGSGYKAIDVGLAGSVYGDTAYATLILSANSYTNGTNYIYKQSAGATRYTQFNGAHTWYNATSGTAGNQITFTQAMTLDASGNLLVGGTAQIYGEKLLLKTASGDCYTTMSNGTGTVYVGWSSSGVGFIGTATNHAQTFYTNGSERARIDSSGNLLVGTTSPMNSSVRGTFQKSGDCYVHSRSTSTAADQQAYFMVSAQDGLREAAFGVYRNGSADACAYVNFIPTNGGGSSFVWSDTSGVLRIGSPSSIGTTGGTVIGTQTSDERLKTIDSTFPYGLETVNQLVPIKYTLNNETTPRLGFGAQTIQTVIPEVVYDSGECIDGYDQDPDNKMKQTPKSDRTRLMMDNIQIIPVLVKAIQEQQAIIETLTNRIQALENK